MISKPNAFSHWFAGWTNYETCYTDQMAKLVTKLYAQGEEEAQSKMKIAERTRTLEICGLRYYTEITQHSSAKSRGKSTLK